MKVNFILVLILVVFSMNVLANSQDKKCECEPAGVVLEHPMYRTPTETSSVPTPDPIQMIEQRVQITDELKEMIEKYKTDIKAQSELARKSIESEVKTAEQKISEVASAAQQNIKKTTAESQKKIQEATKKGVREVHSASELAKKKVVQYVHQSNEALKKKLNAIKSILEL